MKKFFKLALLSALALAGISGCTSLFDLGQQEFADAITNAMNATNGNIQTDILLDSPTNGQLITNYTFTASGFAISGSSVNQVFVFVRRGTAPYTTYAASIQDSGTSLRPFSASITVSTNSTYDLFAQVHDTAGNVVNTPVIQVSVNANGSLPTTPEIAVYKSGTLINTGYSFTNNFGTIVRGTTSSFTTITISNTGNGNLYITNVTDGSGDFTNTAGANYSIGAHGAGTFQIAYTPQTAGTHHAVLRIYNSDNNESPYQFVLKGIATNSSTPTPDIRLYWNTTPISSGYSYTNNFGALLTNQVSSPRSFVISNAGSGNLTITSVTDNSDQFTTQNLSTTLAAGAWTNFTVRFAPTSSLTKYSTVSIINNDNSPYTFTVMGLGTNATTSPEPEIAVYYGSTQLFSGISTNNFGSWLTNQTSSVRSFVISNTGSDTLYISSTVDNSSPQFSTENLVTSIPVGGAASFDITFNASVAGTYHSTITINNDDADESVFTFTARGTATNAGGSDGLLIQDADNDAHVTDSSGANPAEAGLDIDQALVSNTSSQLFVNVTWSDLTWWDTQDVTPSRNPILILIIDVNDTSGGTAQADVEGFTDTPFCTMQNGTFEYFLFHTPTGWGGTGGGLFKKVASGGSGDTVIETWTSAPAKWSATPQGSSSATSRLYKLSLSDMGLSAGDQVRVVILQLKTDYYSTRNVADIAGLGQLADPRASTGTYDISSLAIYTIE